MDPCLANERFALGGTVIFLDAPERMQFGVDMYQWTIGKRFLGLKMIPPGLHIISYSCEPAAAVGHSQSICIHVQPHSLVVYRWLPAIEDVIQIIETEELERFRVNLKQIEPQLGAYPQTSPEELRKYTQWKSLTCHISANVVNRLLVDDGRLTSMTASTIPDETGVQLAGGHSDTTEIQFTCIPLKQSYPPGAIGQERSKYSQDKSWLLSDMLSQRLPANEMLGEMQLAFLLLLVAHNFEGLEQWKLLVQLVCFSREFARSGRAECEEFLERFGKVLRAQLQQVPRDFFEDIVSRGNFLWHSLMHLFGSVFYHGGSTERLKKALRELNEFTCHQFDWDIIGGSVEREKRIDGEGELDGDDDEDGPVVVDMTVENDEMHGN